MLLAWREDPVVFVRDNFGVEPDAWQARILRAFPTNQRLAMKACKGPGKTCVIAWLCWNFLATRPHPKIAATSITSDNLSDGLWTEMSKWQNQSDYLKEKFQWNKTRISSIDHPETWWMSARTWPKSADTSQQADTLAGLHADYLLFVIDEAGGIPDAVMAAAEAGLATGIETKILIAGNPTHLEGPLYRACTSEKDMWFVIEITSDPDNPERTPRVSIQWARDQIRKYGKDNPWVLVNVFGTFPKTSLNKLLGPEEIDAAMSRHLRVDQYDFAQKRLGCDVARFGDDSTIFFPRQGLAAFKYAEMKGLRTNEIATRLISAKTRWRSELEFIDDTGGYGAGVIDAMVSLHHNPQGINFSAKAQNPRFVNIRAEMHWRMAEWVKKGGALPKCETLKKELLEPHYFFVNNRLQIESKEQIKDRLGFSPDRSDALCLTFAISEQPATINIPGQKQGELKKDYEPYGNEDQQPRQSAGPHSYKAEYDPFNS